VTVKVKNDNETFYVAFTNEKVRVYSYKDDGVVTALENLGGREGCAGVRISVKITFIFLTL